jgi:hypothetical protein
MGRLANKVRIMPLSLTCDCGARFEVEDTLAGQSVSCPECQQTLKAPSSAQRPTVRTSAFALASFLLAVVGAFTVVGTLAAVVLGFIAVFQILRNRERLAGFGFAACGIILGLVFTTLTLWSLTTADLFGLPGSMRRAQMADQLDPVDLKAPLEISENSCSITRPSVKWQRAKKDFTYLLVQPLLRNDALLLLVQPDLYAFADVQVVEDPRNPTDIQSYILDRLKPASVQSGVIGKDKSKDKGSSKIKVKEDEDEPPDQVRVDTPVIKDHLKNLPAPPGITADELSVDVPLDGKRWTMLIRTYRTDKGKLFIVRTFTEAARFPRVKDELVKLLDSVTIKTGS